MHDISDISSSTVKFPGLLGDRKSGTPTSMTTGGKQDHAIVAQTLEEIIAPGLSAEVGIGRLIVFFLSSFFFFLNCFFFLLGMSAVCAVPLMRAMPNYGHKRI